MTFDLAAGQLGQLVDELLGGLRCAVLGRVDVAHAQVVVLSRRHAQGGQHCHCGSGRHADQALQTSG